MEIFYSFVESFYISTQLGSVFLLNVESFYSVVLCGEFLLILWRVSTHFWSVSTQCEEFLLSYGEFVIMYGEFLLSCGEF